MRKLITFGFLRGRCGSARPCAPTLKGISMMQAGSMLIALLALLFAPVLPAAAQPLASPKGDPILEGTGRIGVTNAGKSAVFDRDALEALGLEKGTTATPWHSGTVTFEGVRLSRLMQLVGARGKTVR